MRTAEDWHTEFEQAEIAHLIEKYKGVAGFIRAVQQDALQAAIEIVKRDGDRHCSYQVADTILQLTVET